MSKPLAVPLIATAILPAAAVVAGAQARGSYPSPESRATA
jgi:hypothetical protein